MKILDLFCGQGIAARGLQEFGEITGVDIVDYSRHYPGKFILADWDSVDLQPYDFIWASPPCHAYSSATKPSRSKGFKYPDLLEHVILKLQNSGKPFVVENVPQAPFQQSFLLCGQMFNLNMKRHRRFYTNFFVFCQPHPKHKFGVVRVWGHGDKGGKLHQKKAWAEVMGVRDLKNVTKNGLALGVPVAYVRYIMRQYFLFSRPHPLSPSPASC